MKIATSLVFRALVAIVLMVGFYVLALAMIALLLWVPYAEWTYADRIHVKLVFFCVVGAVVIFWSIIPRIDRFQAPGPELKPEEHPELFRNLVEVAGIAGQRMPREVYLVADVNAWVSERGGFMGFGSRRVMGLGLPLLATVTSGQLRAILAHEFGHFHGGDTKLAPWAYKTRAAIARTFQGLAAQRSILIYPFLWYGKAFLRVTEAISRQQELAADRLAVQVAGARNLSDGLVSVHQGAPAFQAYMREEYAPVVEAGFYCPLVDGFLKFLHAPSIEKRISRQLESQLANSQQGPYDSHPPLGERLKRLESLPELTGPVSDGAAMDMITSPKEIERRVLECLVRAEHVSKLTPLTWEEVPARVWLPTWENAARAHASFLAGVTPPGIAKLCKGLDQAIRFFTNQVDAEIKKAQQQQAAEERPVELGLAGHGGALDALRERLDQFQALGAGLILALMNSGWNLNASPGEMYLERQGSRIEPFVVLEGLRSGSLEPQAWIDECTRLGINSVTLGSPGAAADSAPHAPAASPS